jgi:hypothetical protein
MFYRRRCIPFETLEQRLAEEAARLRKQAQGTPPGIEHERLVRRAGQARDGSTYKRMGGIPRSSAALIILSAASGSLGTKSVGERSLSSGRDDTLESTRSEENLPRLAAPAEGWGRFPHPAVRDRF